MFLAMHASNFSPADLPMVKAKLERLDDEKAYLVQSLQFQKPDTIFLIAILLGWERFWLNDVAMGIVKIITAYGCLIWWLVDIFSAKERTMKYNLQQLNKVM